MAYRILMSIELALGDDREAAEAAAKNIYAGVWDLIADQPEPAIKLWLSDGETLVHSITSTKKE